MSRVVFVNGEYLPYEKSKVHIEDRGYQFAEETLKGNHLFGNHLKIEIFDGIHEINTNFIMKISKQNS